MLQEQESKQANHWHAFHNSAAMSNWASDDKHCLKKKHILEYKSEVELQTQS